MTDNNVLDYLRVPDYHPLSIISPFEWVIEAWIEHEKSKEMNCLDGES